MRLFSRTLFSVFGLVLTLSVCCSSTKTKGKKSSRSISNDDSELDHKKFKRFDDSLIKEIQEAIDHEDYYLFLNYIKDNGSLILSSDETCLLKYIFDNDKIEFLEYLLENSKGLGDTFNVMIETISMAAPDRQDIIRAITKPKFIKTEEDEDAILYYLLQMKDEKSLKTVLKNGIKFDKWKNRRESNLVHVAVQKNWTSIINHLSPSGFDKKDKSGLTPIFYATTPEMVKLIRLNCKGARDQVNKKGVVVWQKVLKTKNYDLLNSLISFKRRLKKFRSKQMDFYDIPWVKTASLLKVDRRFLLWDTFKAVKAVGVRWYQPRYKFFIKFIGENGIDAGGLKNDWMTNLLHSLFVSSPQAIESNILEPLFVKVDDETGLYAPNTNYNPEIFRFVGSIIGIALAMNIPIKQKFIPAIYRALMHEEVDSAADLMEQSPAIYRSMQYLNDPSIKISEMQLTLLSKPSVCVNRRLVPKYIKEYSNEVLMGRYEKEIKALLGGFESVLPVAVNEYFTFEELKKILTGKPADYTAEEFIKVLKCENSIIKNSFKRFATEITSVQRGLLLKFITGLNALPADGFEGLDGKIFVEIDENLVGKLPTSSTCTFTIRVPPFTDHETFSSTLITAIEWTGATDNEVGLLTEDEGIELGFDSDHEDENTVTVFMMNESESDVSDSEDSEDSSVSDIEILTNLDITADFLPEPYRWNNAQSVARPPRRRIINAAFFDPLQED